MRLTSISIQNFRGIRSGSIDFPIDRRLFCVIGSGDSCKSTLLKAIEWCLWPSWNLNVTDLDFYNGDTSTPITIEASIAEIPQELLTEDKFGLHLRDYEAVLIGLGNDEPVDGGTQILTIRLTIDETLDPVWAVITDRTEPKQISPRDRKLLSLGIVGSDYEKDFSWGRTSILQRYSSASKGVLQNAFTQAMRAAVDKTDLANLDESTNDIKKIGEQYGVSFNGALHNKLLMQNGSYSSNVGMFDDNVPFSQRGLGSRRLLSMGMNIHASDMESLILVDEIETGLEPYRLCTLINQLRSEFKDKGQVIFTTHSRSAICECSVDELFVISEHEGEVSLYPMAEQDTRDIVQSLIRTEPDAFLCKRLIVCEGKTEIGLLRAFDEYIHENTRTRFAYYGVGTALGGGGDKTFKLAKLLKQCGYDVCILMDSDKSSEEEQKTEMEKAGIAVYSWAAGNAIEEQIFQDFDLSTCEELLKLACKSKSPEHVLNKLNLTFQSDKPHYLEGDVIRLIPECSVEVKRSIGTVAKNKNCEWFKRINLGQEVGDILFAKYAELSDQSAFKITMEKLRKWVCPDET